jgi:hypothetical protein
MALLSLAKTIPAQRFNFRRYLLIVIWIAVVLFLYQIGRPATEEDTIEPESQPPNPVESVIPDDPLSTGWMVAALAVAVAAAVATRLVFIARERADSFAALILDQETAEPSLADHAPPIARVPGDDPRSRVINAYASFEAGALDSGVPRLKSETPRGHAKRVVSELSLDSPDLRTLSEQYEAVRFADTDAGPQEADQAENAWQRLRDRLTR